MRKLFWIILPLVLLATAGISFQAFRPAPDGMDRPPCFGGQVVPANFILYCGLGRNYTTPIGVALLDDLGADISGQFENTDIIYLDIAGRNGRRLWPHRSHIDGRQIDLALYYQRRNGTPMRRPPSFTGYFASAPAREGETVLCNREQREPSRWQLDDERTGWLLRRIVEDQRVQRIFIEPHLAERFGLSGHPKVGFAGCQAARHDEHVHIIIY